MNNNEKEYLLELLEEDDAKKWNDWRKNNNCKKLSFRNFQFVSEVKMMNTTYNLPELHNFDFSNIDFNNASFRNATFVNCNFNNSKLSFNDLVYAYFDECSFENTSFRVSKLGASKFYNCTFIHSDLSYCTADGADFKGSLFNDSYLTNIELVNTNLSNTVMKRCRVYGISAWDLNLENSTQEDLIITKEGQAKITIDNIELAQFMYLIVNNSKLKNVIDALTSRTVLILGRFTDERKSILNIIKDYIRKNGLIPILFDFEGPENKTLIETVVFLANASKFIVADISSPRSIGFELGFILRQISSNKVYPIIVEGQSAFGMIEDKLGEGNIHNLMPYTTESIYDIIDNILDKEGIKKTK